MFKSKFHKGKTQAQIKKSIEQEGFTPIIIQNSADYIYPKHSHPETKLIVVLEGEMCVTVGKKHYQCEPGDEIIIHGNTGHSAKAGPSGCKFFWSEKL